MSQKNQTCTILKKALKAKPAKSQGLQRYSGVTRNGHLI